MAGNKRERFGALLGTITRSISRLERDRVCCGELTLQQFETLSRVERMAAVTVKTLSSDLGIDESTASRNVAVLVRDGYLVKKRHEADGRAVRLALTAKGKAALSTLRCDEEEVLSALFDHLPADERGTVIHALEMLSSALVQQSSACCPPEPAVAAAADRSAARTGRDR